MLLHLGYNNTDICWTLRINGKPVKNFPTGTATKRSEKDSLWISITRGMVGKWLAVSSFEEEYCMGDMETAVLKEDKVWGSVGFQKGNGSYSIRVTTGISEVRHLQITNEQQLTQILSDCANACDKFLKERFPSS